MNAIKAITGKIIQLLAVFALHEPAILLLIPLIISTMNIGVNVMVVMNDQANDTISVHALLSSANSVETLIIGAIIVALKLKQKN